MHLKWSTFVDIKEKVIYFFDDTLSDMWLSCSRNLNELRWNNWHDTSFDFLEHKGFTNNTGLEADSTDFRKENILNAPVKWNMPTCLDHSDSFFFWLMDHSNSLKSGECVISAPSIGATSTKHMVEAVSLP